MRDGAGPAAATVAAVVASEGRPLPAASFAEVVATSDVPAGVVNVLTGRTAELAPVLAAHTGVERPPTLQRLGAFVETKPVWHPAGT